MSEVLCLLDLRRRPNLACPGAGKATERDLESTNASRFGARIRGHFRPMGSIVGRRRGMDKR
jgi:hypothetical protein